MTVKFVQKRIDPGKSSKPSYRSTTVDWRKVRIRVIDANSETLTADLLAGFRASVRYAREENRDLGLTD